MATPAMTTKPRATAPHARMDPHTARRGMFVLEDGRNVVFTFFLLVFLFALWGFLQRHDRRDGQTFSGGAAS